jgi:hypothetical protein
MKTTYSWSVVFLLGFSVKHSEEGNACAAHEDSREDNEGEAASNDHGSLVEYWVYSAYETESDGSSDDSSICNENQVLKNKASLETAADKSKFILLRGYYSQILTRQTVVMNRAVIVAAPKTKINSVDQL